MNKFLANDINSGNKLYENRRNFIINILGETLFFNLTEDEQQSLIKHMVNFIYKLSEQEIHQDMIIFNRC